jgi:hypothetical protein
MANQKKIYVIKLDDDTLHFFTNMKAMHKEATRYLKGSLNAVPPYSTFVRRVSDIDSVLYGTKKRHVIIDKYDITNTITSKDDYPENFL